MKIKQKKDLPIPSSTVSYIQFDMLKTFGLETKNILESSVIGEKTLDPILYNKGYSYIWFWTLGAYELVRTFLSLDFSLPEEKKTKLSDLKKKLTIARICFAKQETVKKKGISKQIPFDSIPKGFDFEKKEHILIVNSKKYSFTDVFKDFNIIFTSIFKEE